MTCVRTTWSFPLQVHLCKTMRSETFSTGAINRAPTMATHIHSGQLLQKSLFFHDVSIVCRTNQPEILALLEEMLGIFPQPQQVRGEVTYDVLCYESASQFPLQLPRARKRTETLRLLTNTRLKYYVSSNLTTEYQSYAALAPINGTALTLISRVEPVVTTQLEMPKQYEPAFLRRYVFLLALGQVLGRFGFEPFHAAAISAPWDAQQGALIIGESGSGKTTLSVGCAIEGCGFLGDDLVMLRAQDQTIAAYAITHEVSVRSSLLDLWDHLAFLWQYPADPRDKRYCSIETIHGGSACLQTPIRLLLFPVLTTQARSQILPLSKARTLQELIEQGISRTHQQHQSRESMFAFLSQLAQQAPGYQLLISRGAQDGPQMVNSLFTGDSHV